MKKFYLFLSLTLLGVGVGWAQSTNPAEGLVANPDLYCVVPGSWQDGAFSMSEDEESAEYSAYSSYKDEHENFGNGKYLIIVPNEVTDVVELDISELEGDLGEDYQNSGNEIHVVFHGTVGSVATTVGGFHVHFRVANCESLPNSATSCTFLTVHFPGNADVTSCQGSFANNPTVSLDDPDVSVVLSADFYYGASAAYSGGVDGDNYSITVYKKAYGSEQGSIVFNADQWYAGCFPFDIPKEGISNGVTIAMLESVSYDNTNNCDVLHWRTVTGGTIPRSTPFIFKSSSAVTSITFTGCTLYSAEDVASDDCIWAKSNGQRTYTLHGIYAMKEYADTDAPWYALTGGTFRLAGSGASLRPFRFYLTVTEDGQTTLAPANTRMMVDDEVVGILEHFFEPQLLIDDNYYDVLGRRIDNPQPGCLYIHQGKKIIYSE